MPVLSVCIEMFWRDLDYAERISRTAELGYTAFEFWGWKNKDIDAIAVAKERSGLALAAFCIEPGQSLNRRNFEDELAQGMTDTAAVAAALDCKTVIVTTGNTYDDESYEVTRRRVVRNFGIVAEIAEAHGLTLVVEPLNTLVNHHGYWLTKMTQAVDIVQEVGSPAAKILMDVYHQQIQEGNIINNLITYVAKIGHIHTAGVPGRHELVGGELDYRGVFEAIDAVGYEGYVGLEFRPTMDDAAALTQALGLVDA